jgi:hypothetical protein
MRLQPSRPGSAAYDQSSTKHEASRSLISLPPAWTIFSFRKGASRKIIGSTQTSTAPSNSRHPRRKAYIVIKPEEQNRNNWTKVSFDTFVSIGESRLCCRISRSFNLYCDKSENEL